MITYRFEIAGADPVELTVDPDRPASTARSDLPEWTRLPYNRCDNCPLSADEHPRCPAAVDMTDIIAPFHDIVSYERVEVTVETPERTYKKECDVQMALHSVLGLVLSTSACPILSELSAMGHHHLPFASPKETIYRTAANYLLKQFFAEQRGGKPDYKLEALRELYSGLQTVNGALVKRITSAAKKDANLNALVLLFSVAVIVGQSLDDDMKELGVLFPE